METRERSIVRSPEQQALDEPTWAEQLGSRMDALGEIRSRLQTVLHPDVEAELVDYHQGIEAEIQDLMDVGRSRGWLG